MSEQVREIVKKYLVISEKGPLILTANKSKCDEVEAKAKEKKVKCKTREVFLDKPLMERLADNLFIKKIKVEGNIQEFRNKLIKEYHSYDLPDSNQELVWKKVARKYGIDLSLDEFNSWCMDQLEYNKLEYSWI